MFIELISPEPKDIIQSRDRIKLRLSEPQASGRFWLSLTFLSENDLIKFSKDLQDLIARKREYSP